MFVVFWRNELLNKITEELAFLQLTEKQQTKAQFRDYIRFLRLLKSTECTTQQAPTSQVNLSLRQAQRLWKVYQHEDLAALIQPRQATYLGPCS